MKRHQDLLIDRSVNRCAGKERPELSQPLEKIVRRVDGVLEHGNRQGIALRADGLEYRTNLLIIFIDIRELPLEEALIMASEADGELVNAIHRQLTLIQRLEHHLHIKEKSAATVDDFLHRAAIRRNQAIS